MPFLSLVSGFDSASRAASVGYGACNQSLQATKSPVAFFSRIESAPGNPVFRRLASCPFSRLSLVVMGLQQLRTIMPRIACLILILFSTSNCDAQQLAQASDSQVLFFRDDSPVEIAKALQAEISAGILETLRATAFESTSYVDAEHQWQRLARGSYLLLQYAHPRKITAYRTRKVLATEVLIPVSQDDHYLVRNAVSETYWAFTKMWSIERAKLICRPELLIEQNKSFCAFMARVGEGGP